MPQLQRAQHQPLKSSPSTQIKRLSIQRHLIYLVRDSSSGATGGTHGCNRAQKVDSCPSQSIFYGIEDWQSD